MPQPLKKSRRDFLTTSLAGVGGVAAFPSPLLASSARPAAGGRLAELEAALPAMEKQVERFMWVPRSDGRLLNLLVRLAKARHVLQIGTSVGFAALWLTEALEVTGGTLTTLELLPERVEIAKANAAQMGLARRITFLAGNAHELVPTLKGSFDFVVLDADKSGHLDYFNKLFPKKLKRGALLLSNNAVKPQEGMKEYLDRVMQCADFQSVIVNTTLEDGYCMSLLG
jgi:predicted O-methyltransferase YrrM